MTDEFRTWFDRHVPDMGAVKAEAREVLTITEQVGREPVKRSPALRAAETDHERWHRKARNIATFTAWYIIGVALVLAVTLWIVSR